MENRLSYLRWVILKIINLVSQVHGNQLLFHPSSLWLVRGNKGKPNFPSKDIYSKIPLLFVKILGAKMLKKNPLLGYLVGSVLHCCWCSSGNFRRKLLEKWPLSSPTDPRRIPHCPLADELAWFARRAYQIIIIIIIMLSRFARCACLLPRTLLPSCHVHRAGSGAQQELVGYILHFLYIFPFCLSSRLISHRGGTSPPSLASSYQPRLPRSERSSPK